MSTAAVMEGYSAASTLAASTMEVDCPDITVKKMAEQEKYKVWNNVIV